MADPTLFDHWRFISGGGKGLSNTSSSVVGFPTVALAGSAGVGDSYANSVFGQSLSFAAEASDPESYLTQFIGKGFTASDLVTFDFDGNKPSKSLWMKNFAFQTPEPAKTTASIPPKQEASPEIEVLGEWDGYVDAIHRDYFVGRMHGLRGHGVAGKDEEAEIPISDVDEADRDLLALGGFFRLMVSYEKPRVGPKRKFTTIIFRRLPAYTARELDAAKREANEIADAFQLAAGRQASGA